MARLRGSMADTAEDVRERGLLPTCSLRAVPTGRSPRGKRPESLISNQNGGVGSGYPAEKAICKFGSIGETAITEPGSPGPQYGAKELRCSACVWPGGTRSMTAAKET